MRSDKGYRAAGVSESAHWLSLTDFSPPLHCSGWLFSTSVHCSLVDFFPLCTAVAEFDWHPLWKINDLTPIKSSPRLFSQIHISFLSDSHRAPKLPIFCETRLNQACRRRLKWKQCRVPCLLHPLEAKGGFSGALGTYGTRSILWNGAWTG